MRRTCVLLRHGQTPGNVRRCYIGCGTDEDLTEAAKQAGSHDCAEIRKVFCGVYAVCASPMKRALSTAAFFTEPEKILVVDALKEMDFGPFEGKTYEELKDRSDYLAWINSGGEKTPFGTEKKGDFIRRSTEGFQEALVRSLPCKDLVVVCHGGTIMAVMCELTGGAYFSFAAEHYGGYRLELEQEDERVHLLSYDRFGGRVSSGSSDR
ncbi:MAG: histidine phosphatase family protein [Lachnospiraceae bacterium]|nr:histidine phosphatase family protein [Lachnospiraceae bacterium]